MDKKNSHLKYSRADDIVQAINNLTSRGLPKNKPLEMEAVANLRMGAVIVRADQNMIKRVTNLMA